MNEYQVIFSAFWNNVENSVFYKVINIMENATFVDKILDKQRAELSECIRNEIDRTFFDSDFRPEATVWFEELETSYPEKAHQLRKALGECDIASKLYENIIAITIGSTAAVTGAAIGKKSPVASTLMILAGGLTAGYKIASGLRSDTSKLQSEVRNQFGIWREDLLKILEGCGDDTDLANDENE